MEGQLLPIGDEGYRKLGLMANPFLMPDELHTYDSPGGRVMSHVAAVQLISVLEQAADEERHHPVWIQRNPRLVQSATLEAYTEMLRAFMRDADSLRILPVQIGLEMMRESRIRGVLGVVTEMVAGPLYARPLAAWSAGCLEAPDESLAEWVLLGEYDVPAIAAFAREDGDAFVDEYFGEMTMERADSEESGNLFRISGVREQKFEPNPDETADSDEFDADDPLQDTLVTGLDEEAPGVPVGAADGSEAEVDPDEARRAAVREYVIAHTRANLSPVVARGIAAYHAQGSFAAGQEMRMTKAPKKTLTAVLKFARAYWKSVALIFSRFEPWELLQEDYRLEFLGAFAQLRWVVGDNGLMCFLAQPGQVPELEEAFAGGHTFTFELTEAPKVQAWEAPFDREVVDAWIEAAKVPGVGASIAETPAIDRLAEEADGDLAAFIAMAGAAIEDAAQRQVGQLDDTALAAGIAAKPVEATQNGDDA